MKALSALAAFEVPVRSMDFGTLKVRVVAGVAEGAGRCPGASGAHRRGRLGRAGDVARDDQDRRGGKEQGCF